VVESRVIITSVSQKPSGYVQVLNEALRVCHHRSVHKLLCWVRFVVMLDSLHYSYSLVPVCSTISKRRNDSCARQRDIARFVRISRWISRLAASTITLPRPQARLQSTAFAERDNIAVKSKYTRSGSECG